MQLTQSQKAQIQWVKSTDGVILLKSFGDWTIDALRDASGMLENFSTASRNVSIQWDVSDVGRVDSAGMMLFIHYYDLLKSNNCSIEVIGVKDEHEKMYRLLREYTPEHPVVGPAFSSCFLRIFNGIGKISVAFVLDMGAFLSFVGENFVIFLTSLLHPFSIRFGAIVKNIEDAGVRAMPIVALTSFLIGIVVAYQAAVQLEKFGAHIFIVDMISISVTRELAPLITAIVVAGRTGSSYTAQLGVMKITEEIDVMRTMGFDPHRFLVLPRIMALMIALPLMIFFADIVGILGGMFISHVHLHLSYAEFLHRLQTVLEMKHVWIGIGKGPFFAWLIASVGCFRGFQVSKSTESIGRYTTISVVNAIFLVIACDALFSVILTELGI
ncbi:MAG: MlaE family lipid ABC transporter permease subunit [Deltaproteobacteria bacterium]|nr:MlaE family lipid ABC transporter permease subunit [Deltaproteobacteria bacterium]MBW1719741.1 MlaE family lipid ABC transporter permease subunit [Deltaproteobacteria bacterium]MBW1939102.1 MlaE family lipid ABC transporter permease subunit [Deltaproteobacteria bacterium]MBW1964589.1 MlaE family lipid ABC transporter permease subunit [Deltaproteobacteria bacterium]MBW2080290.1 MlaE family lipid ABC transporter permease subunit [Deltaproteobacteria bacterium]